MKLSISALADATGFDRKTVAKRLEGLPFEQSAAGGETKGAKLFDLKAALHRLYNDGKPTAQTAARDLAIAKRKQVELDMEIKRRERIPLDVVKTVNEEAICLALAILKAREGKCLTAETLAAILAELRDIGSKLKSRFDYSGSI